MRIIGSYAPITSRKCAQCGFSGIGFDLSGLEGWGITRSALFSLIDADAERRLPAAGFIRGIPQSSGADYE
jgi:hypothetical protein